MTGFKKENDMNRICPNIYSIMSTLESRCYILRTWALYIRYRFSITGRAPATVEPTNISWENLRYAQYPHEHDCIDFAALKWSKVVCGARQ